MVAPDHISRKRIVYTLPAIADVSVRRDHEYASHDGSPLTMDVYYPPGVREDSRAPAVVFVTGFRDAGAQKMLGCKFKEMGSFVSWAQLAAASGMVGVTYENREPAADAEAVLRHLREHGTTLGIDANRIAVWSCSGHVPSALSLLMSKPAGVKCAVLCYGYMLDLDGHRSVADAAGAFGFANPAAAKSVDDLPRDLPLLIARAGRDEMPGLNDAIDRFVGHALAGNLPITLINHADAPHAFDLLCDDEASRRIVARILEFMRAHLGA